MSNNWHTPTPDLIEGDIARADDVNAKIDAVDLAFEKLPEPAVGGKGFGEPIKVGDPTDATHAASKGWAETEGTSFVNQSATSAANAAASETAAATSETNAASSATASATSATAAAGSASSASSSETAAASSADLAERYAEEDEDVEVESGTFSAKHWSNKALASANDFSTIVTDFGSASAENPSDTLTIEGAGGLTVSASGTTVTIDAGVESLESTIPDSTLEIDTSGVPTYRYATASKIAETEDVTDLATFTRGGDVVNYFGPNGLITASAIDEPVVEYDPGTRFRRGLLLEPARTNDLLSSDQDANWSDSQVTSTKNATGPDGVASSAYTVLETASNSTHFASSDAFTIVAEENRVAFALVKQAGLSAANDRHFRLRLGSNNVATDFIYHDVDLFDGSSVAAATSGNASLIDSGIEDAGGGYYRVWVSGAFDALTSDCKVLAQSRTPGLLSYAGDTSKGFILYAADCTEGDFPTSHIDTAGSAATRAGSQLDIQPAEAVNILNTEEGTLVCTINVLAYSASQVLIASVFLMDGTSADRVDLNINSDGAGGLNALFRSIISGAQEDGAATSLGSVAFGTKVRLALTYSKGGNLECSVNGATLAVTQGDVWNGDVDRIRLTSALALAHEKVFYKPKRLTQAQLNFLTRAN